MKRAKHVLMVLSGKGGVGKTTVAVNVACALAKGLRVGLLDADLHGPNVPKMFGIERATMPVKDGRILPVPTPYNLGVVSIAFGLPDADTPLIWRGPLKMKAIRQLLEEVEWGKLDLLVVDLPPGTGDEPLSMAQVLGEVDAALVVTTPQQMALLDARKAVNFSRRVGVKRVGVVENMASLVCPHCGAEIDLFGVGGGEEMARELGAEFLGRLPMLTEVVQAGDAGRPAVAGDSRAREAFLDLALRTWDFVRGPAEG
ncbi:Mrp/NBP35 family ATP-binding protein [Candidatus Bipolaricaulota bacterium]|nr:Mrp/NBP35 family ATP-binding protein [Candidatus Bipolaricaulota bacterium]